MNEYKVLLVLAYLNTVNNSFYYQEMKDLLGYSTKQLKNFLNELSKAGLIYYNEEEERILLLEKSKELLKKEKLLNVDFLELLIPSEEILKKNKTRIKEEIYIPKNFEL